MIQKPKSVMNYMILLASLILLQGCGSSGTGILKGPPKCSIPRNCIKIDLNQTICKTINGVNHFQWVAKNENPNDVVSVTFIKKYFVESWIPYPIDANYPGYELRQIGIGGSTILGCSFDTVDGVYREISYEIQKVCPGTETCNFSLPTNADISLLDCKPSEKCDYCLEIDYKSLTDNTQKKSITEFYLSMLNKLGTNYNFKNDLSMAFFASLPNNTCGKRISVLKNDNTYVSEGANNCINGFSVNPSIFLKGTKETFSKMWVNIPNKITGKLLNNNPNTKLLLNRENGQSINVTVELDANKQIRSDYISQIIAYKNEKILFITGDFICIKIINLPVD
ncbi:hypothetical protein [Chryseobacterium sp. 3008163]|uniref:hypothetical protein n=1 Tax=Chryseobacterium sp. 3008163 TaxID=2478663 RepID=UPI000F0C23A6|nr:hypothetical protein [Chryseobacterium sp. 3008163]AYN02028.1 hypothetical protein EAG08_18565 [Chryseobacterium sp. 3008163]